MGRFKYRGAGRAQGKKAIKVRRKGKIHGEKGNTSNPRERDWGEGRSKREQSEVSPGCRERRLAKKEEPLFSPCCKEKEALISHYGTKEGRRGEFSQKEAKFAGGIVYFKKKIRAVKGRDKREAPEKGSPSVSVGRV